MAFTFKHGDRPLAGYEIQRAVGRGGFGEVYYAISDGGREVALKYLREHPEIELRGVAQCINLKSPHLVSIFDVKQNDQGEYFVIMEYISGPSLRDMLIAEPKGLGPQKAAFFLREIAKGLGYLHDRGIVHRDLKPGNIFYDEGYVKICDYGLSKFISISRHSAQTTSIGTVHYMAPEVGSGNYSKTIDIYALGVVLYEMLLGRVPYEGASMGEILMKHLTDQPEVSQLPAPFGDVIRKALAKDPKERYQDVNEMVADLFEVDDVKQSMMGFEPASLTMVAARVAEDIRPSPVPSDNPPRQGGGFGRAPRQPQSANDFSRRFVERTAGLDPWMTKKERRQAKRDKKRRRNAAPQLLGKDDEASDLIRSPYHIGFGRRLGRLFAASLVAVGLAAGIGLIAQDGELAAISIPIIMISVVGIGLGTKIANWLGPDHPKLIGRLLAVAFAAPAAVLVYGAVGDGNIGAEVLGGGRNHLHLPLLAAFALFNWRERIRDGMRGDFSVWEAAWTGFLAFICAMIMSEGEHEASAIWIGGIVGSLALTLQAFSWAMIRNPLPLVEDVAPGLEGSHRGRIEDAPVGHRGDTPHDADSPFVAMGVIGLGESGSAPGDIPPQHLRSTALRVTAGVLACASALGIIAMSILLGLGQIGCGSDEHMCAITLGIVGQSLFFLFWLGTTTRTKRIGMWSEWLNPMLRVGVGTALAAGIIGLAVLRVSGDDFAGLVILVVFSSLAFIALLIFRQSKRKQLKKYRRRNDDDQYGSGGVGGRRIPVEAELRPGIDDAMSNVVREINDSIGAVAMKVGEAFGGERGVENPAASANAVSPIAPRRACRSRRAAGAAVAIVIGIAVVSVLFTGGRRAPMIDASAGNFISVDADDVEIIATTDGLLPHFHRAPRPDKRITIAKVALASGVIVAALLMVTLSRRRHRNPPDFLKRP